MRLTVSVDRARQNALLSGFGDRPIRWIPEDAMKFCQREVKRGNQYDAVILDPPTYGHGPKGEPWKIGEHLLPLLAIVRRADGRQPRVRARDVPFAGHRAERAVGVFGRRHLRPLRPAAGDGRVVFGNGRRPAIAERRVCAVAAK